MNTLSLSPSPWSDLRMPLLATIADEIEQIEGPIFHGEVTSAVGGVLETSGMSRRFAVGDKCWATARDGHRIGCEVVGFREGRSEEHTSELQSLMRISYAVFCLKKQK